MQRLSLQKRKYPTWREFLLSFKRIDSDRSVFIPLLLEGDEDMAMLDRYLHKGEMFGLYDEDMLAVLAIVIADGGIAEIMNIVTEGNLRGMGYGSAMLSFLSAEFSLCEYLIAGTGDSSSARAFYEKNGFAECGVRKGFFLQYSHPVIENGRRLVDMIMYQKRLKQWQ